MGSTDTAVMRYTAVNVTIGAGAWTLVETAANGSVLTCAKGGWWMVELFAALAGAGGLDIGISRNAAAAGALTGPPADFAAVDAGAGSMGVIACSGDLAGTASAGHFCSRLQRFEVGDTLRFLATAAVTLDAANSRFFLNPVLLDR
jgi:hypothetical protein